MPDEKASAKPAKPSEVPKVEEQPAEPAPEGAAYAGKGLEAPGPGQAVTSVTTVIPHEADASSAAGPYEGLSVDRPPVSSSKSTDPVAHSLVAGAGEGNQGQPEEEG